MGRQAGHQGAGFEHTVGSSEAQYSLNFLFIETGQAQQSFPSTIMQSAFDEQKCKSCGDGVALVEMKTNNAININTDKEITKIIFDLTINIPFFTITLNFYATEESYTYEVMPPN